MHNEIGLHGEGPEGPRPTAMLITDRLFSSYFREEFNVRPKWSFLIKFYRENLVWIVVFRSKSLRDKSFYMTYGYARNKVVYSTPLLLVPKN